MSSDSDISKYTVTVIAPGFAYKLRANDNDPVGEGPDDGTYDLIAKDKVFVTASGNTLTIEKLPSKWDGIEFEYDIAVEGNGKKGF